MEQGAEHDCLRQSSGLVYSMIGDCDPHPVPDPTSQGRPSSDRSTIGKSLLIKGEITGAQNPYTSKELWWAA